jgi:hypothetical protein
VRLVAAGHALRSLGYVSTSSAPRHHVRGVAGRASCLLGTMEPTNQGGQAKPVCDRFFQRAGEADNLSIAPAIYASLVCHCD